MRAGHRAGGLFLGPGQRLVGNRLAAADHDRYLRRLHVKAIEQLPYIGVPVKIEVLEGVAIAR